MQRAFDYNEIPAPYAIFLIFVTILDYPYFGRSEKTAWEIPMFYRDTPVWIAFRKFGLEATLGISAENGKSKIEAMITTISRAVEISENILQPKIDSLVKSGYFTIRNYHRQLRSRYGFFREEAIGSFAKAGWDITAEQDYRHAFLDYLKNADLVDRGEYFSTAMIDSYFSWLEHFLVLAIPFLQAGTAIQDVPDFMRLSWADKLKRVFNLSTDAAAKGHYDILLAIKEEHRNPAAHGEYDKRGSNILVHMPKIGAIPLSLSRTPDYVKYELPMRNSTSFGSIIGKLDSFDQFIGEGSLSRAFEYAESGLPLAYDERSRTALSDASKSDEAFTALLHKIAYFHDEAANMDW